MKYIIYKIIKKTLYVKALQEILKYYNNSIYVVLIHECIEQQGTWFLEVAQHQLVFF